MESSSLNSSAADSSTSCSLGCRYAETLRGEYSEWIWCARPGALNRVRHVSSECRMFTSIHSLPPNAMANDQTPSERVSDERASN